MAQGNVGPDDMVMSPPPLLSDRVCLLRSFSPTIPGSFQYLNADLHRTVGQWWVLIAIWKNWGNSAGRRCLLPLA